LAIFISDLFIAAFTRVTFRNAFIIFCVLRQFPVAKYEEGYLNNKAAMEKTRG
jgi:hypothetical protein